MKLPGSAKILPDGHLAIGGVDAVDLVREYGSPLWVVDEEHFRGNARAYREAFGPDLFPGGADVVYASKSLLTLAICRIAEDEGLCLDVVSGGELATARAAGYAPERIFFHGNNKTRPEIREGLEAGVGRFMVDNLPEIGHLEAELAELDPSSRRRADVILRLAPGVEPDTHDYVKTGQTSSKFGLPIETGQALEAVERLLASPRLVLRGLHCHLGSQILSPEPYARAAAILMDFAGEVRDRTGWVAQEISLGGGFGVRYVDGDVPPAPSAYAAAISQAVTSKSDELGLPVPRVLIEPGRAISATAGWTLYTVGNVKDIPGLRSYVAVDGGMADNPRPALYQARYEACLANRAAEPLADPPEVFTIVGRYCESGDVVVNDIPLPRPEPGDIVAVSCTGAYNYTMSMNYNRQPRPAMVLVNRGQAEVILERETYADLLARDRLPERLARPGEMGAAQT